MNLALVGRRQPFGSAGADPLRRFTHGTNGSSKVALGIVDTDTTYHLHGRDDELGRTVAIKATYFCEWLPL
jgi:hypothetical protein